MTRPWTPSRFRRALGRGHGRTDCPSCLAAGRWQIVGVTRQYVPSEEGEISVLIVVCDQCGLVQQYLETVLEEGEQ